jgi:mannose/fructose/N-acetylgalactosamine-specific phosphotransferase system component IIC
MRRSTGDSPAVDARPLGESRWPPALALLGFMALNVALRIWLPSGQAVRVTRLIPAVEAALVVMLLAGDHFLDYLHLGFTNATAFSPTDVMPLTYKAKYTMLTQSTVSLALVGLIVARAVNAFT